ncbi:hypothetical protein LN650_21415 [Klebsiella pneumoniae subsp. pneumoniae]|nr:hypothetical protein [Klebsiella pneumoniae subsp. pneumoniae]
MLQSDPEQFEQLKEDYAYAQQTQRDARQQAFCPGGSCACRAHFSYSDSAEMLQRHNSDLNEKAAPASGAGAESERSRARDAMRAHAAQLSQYNPGAGLAEELVMTPRKSCSTILYKEVAGHCACAPTPARKSVLARVAMSCTCS